MSTEIAQVVDIARRAGSGEDSEDVAMQAICTFWRRRRELLWDQAKAYQKFACLEAQRELGHQRSTVYIDDQEGCQLLATDGGNAVLVRAKDRLSQNDDGLVAALSVREALERCSDPLSQNIAQQVMDGFSYSTVAKANRISKATVYRRIRDLAHYVA